MQEPSLRLLQIFDQLMEIVVPRQELLSVCVQKSRGGKEAAPGVAEGLYLNDDLLQRIDQLVDRFVRKKKNVQAYRRASEFASFLLQCSEAHPLVTRKS